MAYLPLASPALGPAVTLDFWRRIRVVLHPQASIHLVCWLQRWDRTPVLPPWLLGSDPALLPPAAGPASSTSSPLLASLPLQPPLDLKHLLAFHLNGATPLSLFPNFSTVRRVG